VSAKQPELESLVGRKYRHGFVTDIASDTVPPGLDEDVIRLISAKKEEPAFMLDWRLKAFRRWTKMTEPGWAHVHYPPIDFQAISYYSAPKQRTDGPKSLADVDPKLLETYDKLGIPLHERARLAGVAIPAHEDTEQTLEELKARIAKTIAFIDTVKPAQVDGSEEREVVLKMRSGEVKFKGMQYLLGHALPNFYFHVTTAYNILRHNGVEIGKRDYIGTP